MTQSMIFLVLLTLHAICVAELTVDTSQTPAYRTALSLNYAHASLYTITDYKDRIVLDQEYRNILNNIKLSVIQDEELIDILKQLLDTLNKYLLSDKEQEIIKNIYQHKIDEAFYKSFSRVYSKAVSLAGADPILGAFVTVTSVGSEMMNYRNSVKEYREKINQETWELKKDQATQLTNLRKQFLMYYWTLMRKYEIPDHWRITEEQFANLLEILKDEDKTKQYRRLDSIKGQFEAYPPFWYHLGNAAQSIKKYDAARDAYDFVIKRHVDYFRDDTIYATVLLNLSQLYSYQNDKETIEGFLDEIIKTNPNDSSKTLSVALYYGGIGKYSKAIELLQKNIDENFMVELHTRLLAEFNVYAGNEDNLANYRQLTSKMIKQVNFKNHDILYLIAKTNDRELVNAFYHKIKGISFRYEKGWMGIYLYITLAKQWVVYDNDKPIPPTLIDLNGEKNPFDTIENKETESISFKYSGILPLEEFPDKKFPYEFRIKLPTRDNPITLVVKYFYEEEKEASVSLRITKFVYYQLETNNNCYRIINDKLEPKSCK